MAFPGCAAVRAPAGLPARQKPVFLLAVRFSPKINAVAYQVFTPCPDQDGFPSQFSDNLLRNGAKPPML
jgi:hypothetical protein